MFAGGSAGHCARAVRHGHGIAAGLRRLHVCEQEGIGGGAGDVYAVLLPLIAQGRQTVGHDRQRGIRSGGHVQRCRLGGDGWGGDCAGGHIVKLDECDAGGVADPADLHGIDAGIERNEYGRVLAGIAEREGPRGPKRRLQQINTAPIVVLEQRRGGALPEQRELGVGDGAGDAQRGEARTNRSDEQRLGRVALEHKAGNEDRLAGADPGPRRKVDQLGTTGRSGIVDFNQRHSGSSGFAGDVRRIGSASQDRQQHRVATAIRQRESAHACAGRNQLARRGHGAPIVVGGI